MRVSILADMVKLGTCFVICALAVACGADGDSTGGADASPDAVLPGADAAPPACGPGPYATLSGTFRSLADETVVIPGVRLTVDLCPEEEFVADAQGFASFRITKDVPVTAKLEHPDYLPMLTSVDVIEEDLDASGLLIPTSLSGLLPHWSSETPTMLVVVFLAEAELPVDAPEACKSRAGIGVSVIDHPEAVITYFADGGVPTPDPNLTATSALGLVEISGLVATAPGETVQLSAVNPACPLVALTTYPHTDRSKLENGVLTGVAVRIPARPWPSGMPPG